MLIDRGMVRQITAGRNSGCLAESPSWTSLVFRPFRVDRFGCWSAQSKMAHTNCNRSSFRKTSKVHEGDSLRIYLILGAGKVTDHMTRPSHQQGEPRFSVIGESPYRSFQLCRGASLRTNIAWHHSKPSSLFGEDVDRRQGVCRLFRGVHIRY
jgi:hypothetical protein